MSVSALLAACLCAGGCLVVELPNRPRPAQDRDLRQAEERKHAEDLAETERREKRQPIVCDEGRGNCDSDARNGCETDLSATSSCGACDKHCPPSATCEQGACVVAARPRVVSRGPSLRAHGATSLAHGQRLGCAIVGEGAASCWERGDHGSAGVKGLSLVSAGYPNACAITESHGVVCWGSNVYGALGDGTIDQKTHAVPVAGLTDVVSLGVGWFASCAVRRDGTVACWGKNLHGELGKEDTESHRRPYEVPAMKDAVAVTGGDGFFCALGADHHVTCWGDGAMGQMGDGKKGDDKKGRRPTHPKGLERVVSVAAGKHHVCAALENGHVKCWGMSGTGAAGRLVKGTSDVPVDVPDIDGVVELSAAEGVTCARRTAGDVWCWGSQPFPLAKDELRTSGAHDPRPAPGLDDAVQIAVGIDELCARRAGGDVVCFER